MLVIAEAARGPVFIITNALGHIAATIGDGHNRAALIAVEIAAVGIGNVGRFKPDQRGISTAKAMDVAAQQCAGGIIFRHQLIAVIVGAGRA